MWILKAWVEPKPMANEAASQTKLKPKAYKVASQAQLKPKANGVASQASSSLRATRQPHKAEPERAACPVKINLRSVGWSF